MHFGRDLLIRMHLLIGWDWMDAGRRSVELGQHLFPTFCAAIELGSGAIAMHWVMVGRVIQHYILLCRSCFIWVMFMYASINWEVNLTIICEELEMYPTL
jgi:hypothetical protein